MTKQDFDNKTFDKLMEQLNEEMEDIHNRESMLDMAKFEIDNENLFVAIHILEGLWDEYAEWYQYDVTMGTLDSVMALRDKEDLEHLVYDEE